MGLGTCGPGKADFAAWFSLVLKVLLLGLARDSWTCKSIKSDFVAWGSLLLKVSLGVSWAGGSGKSDFAAWGSLLLEVSLGAPLDLGTCRSRESVRRGAACC